MNELAFIRRYQRKPALFVREVLGQNLTDIQEQIINSLVDHSEVAVKSSHGQGKSFVSACAALWFLCCHKPSKVVTTAPGGRQVEGIVWAEIARLHRDALVELPGIVLTKQLKIDAEWYAWGFTAPEYNPDKFVGFHSPHMLVVADEASGISDHIFDAILSVLTGEHTRLLMIGNPTNPSGRFAGAFRKPSQSSKRFTISAFENPNLAQFGITLEDIREDRWKAKLKGPLPWPQGLVDASWVRRAWERWGEQSPLFQARVMAQFPSVSDDALVPISWVELANQRWDAAVWSGVATMGLDVARLGPDATVGAISYRQGIRELIRFRKASTMETAGMAIEAIRSRPQVREVRVDADGLGAGVYDALVETLGDKVVEMRGGFASRDSDRFFNRRSEWIWTLREQLDPASENPIALPRDDRLTAQLTTIKWSTTRKGQIQVEPKDELRKRLGESPDELDACAYAVAKQEGEAATIALDPDVGRSANQWAL